MSLPSENLVVSDTHSLGSDKNLPPPRISVNAVF